MEKNEIWHVVKVTKLGNSLGIVLDKRIREFEEVEEGEWVKIKIRKIKKKS